MMPSANLRLNVVILSMISLFDVLLPAVQVSAQRVILNEDFEEDAPDALPASADFFAKSSVASFAADFDANHAVNGKDFLIWQSGFGVGTTKAEGDANSSSSVNDADLAIWQGEFGEGDPATAKVTGGSFADPFAPGTNQSLVLHNPNGSSQMAVTWTDEFMDDPSTFRNGTIEFDLWMESPDPEAFWTFLGLRIGHGGEDRNSVQGTQADTTIWTTFRLQNLTSGDPPTAELLEQLSDPGQRIALGVEGTYTDDNSAPDAGAFGPDQSVHVRIEVDANGYTLQDLPTYRLFLNDTQIEWMGTVFGPPDEHPWVFQPGPALAPGINTITLITDASAFNTNMNPGTGNVYIDNFVITNNDLPPLISANASIVPEPSGFFIVCSLATFCVVYYRNRR